MNNTHSNGTSNGAPNGSMQGWKTAIVTSDPSNIWIRGYDTVSLMRRGSFADVIYLLHRGELPTAAERRLIEALLIGISDHGAGAPSCAVGRMVASSNRQSVAAAVAAGVLAIGDEHGGAGTPCMEQIAAVLSRRREDGLSLQAAAAAVVEQAISEKRRLAGFGHRVHHTKDPRIDFLFGLARKAKVAGDGVKAVQALEGEIARRIKPLPANIDAALAAILHDLGFPPSAARFLFIIGRVAGITAEIAEEYARERPMRVRIPVAYDGHAPRKLAPRKAGRGAKVRKGVRK
jgi:citrate synthase